MPARILLILISCFSFLAIAQTPATNPGGVQITVLPNSPTSLPIRVQNPSGAGLNAKVTLTGMEGFDIEENSQSVELKPGETETIVQFPFKTQGGEYALGVQLTDEKGQVLAELPQAHFGKAADPEKSPADGAAHAPADDGIAAAPERSTTAAKHRGAHAPDGSQPGLQVLWLLVLAIPVSCVAWTVTHEEIFKEPREYCVRRSEACRRLVERKFFYLFTCEYCFSHYVTAMFLWMTGFKLLLDDWRGYVLSLFAVVYVANAYMSLYNRLRVVINVDRTELKVKQQVVKENDRKAGDRDEGDRGEIQSPV